jgi:hypothetical protein
VTTAGAIDELDDHQHAAVHAAGGATGHDASGDADAGDGRMFCYRHPDRETWLRCGRCDQPICTKCSVMGPVGARCRVCGLRPNDGLSKFTPRQLVLGTGVTLAAGLALGYLGAQLGFFAIIGGFFVGGFAAELFNRVVGYKRGPVMLTMLFGGLIVGTLAGMAFSLASLFGAVPGEAAEPLTALMLQSYLPYALVSAGAACAGAYSRFR